MNACFNEYNIIHFINLIGYEFNVLYMIPIIVDDSTNDESHNYIYISYFVKCLENEIKERYRMKIFLSRIARSRFNSVVTQINRKYTYCFVDDVLNTYVTI